MALAAVTRFDDPQEGLIAASALNAAGIPAVCHAGGLGDVWFTMRQGTYGFGLWVDAENLREARAFVAERRTFNPEALDWKRSPDCWRAAPLALLCVLDANFTGWLIAGAKARPNPARIGITLGVITLYAVILGSVVSAFI